MPPLVIASDGRQDEHAPLSIATLLFDPSNGRKIAIAAVTQPRTACEHGAILSTASPWWSKRPSSWGSSGFEPKIRKEIPLGGSRTTRRCCLDW